MGAGASESEDEDAVFFLVDKKPIGGNVAFIVARPFARKGMIVVFGGKRLIVCEHGDNFE